MKIKKFFGSLAMCAVMAGGSMTVTSCGSDDLLDTVLEIVDIILSPSDLSGTAWIASDYSMALEFTSGSSGRLYTVDYADEDGSPIPQSFTYSVNTSSNTLTIRLSSQTLQFVIEEFEANESLVLSYNGYNMYFVPYTE